MKEIGYVLFAMQDNQRSIQLVAQITSRKRNGGKHTLENGGLGSRPCESCLTVVTFHITAVSSCPELQGDHIGYAAYLVLDSLFLSSCSTKHIKPYFNTYIPQYAYYCHLQIYKDPCCKKHALMLHQVFMCIIGLLFRKNM